MDKKGQVGIGGVPNFVWALVQIGIFVAIGLIVLAQFEATTTNTDASTAINSTITAIDDVPAWIPILVVMLMAGIVVALVQIFRSR
ncbi:MAG: hypothetical protein H8E98_05030 [Bacteroidetes bacterium]|nr:hypothetical protein [Bacteroidota bacterium]